MYFIIIKHSLVNKYSQHGIINSKTPPPPLHPLRRHRRPAAYPSAHPNTSNATTPDALSQLLHRLPPTLSLSFPTRRLAPLSSTTTTTPPLINLSDPTPYPNSALLSAATKLGFFHLTTPHHHHTAAVSAAASLFNLPHETKQTLFPNNNWPLGYDTLDQNDDVDDVSAGGESFCLELSSSTESKTELGLGLDLGPLREFGLEMEKLGLLVIKELGSVVGFENPGKDRLCCMTWISDGMSKPGRVYPYAIGLHCQMMSQKYSLLSDSGWVNVSGQADSVLVTLGDIAQVWSNGKLKKVTGIPIPMPSMDSDIVKNSTSSSITISLLITLPLESMVCPLIPGLAIDNAIEEHENDHEDRETRTSRSMFRSFSFEDYAWRVYHERHLLKDPLVRYRV